VITCPACGTGPLAKTSETCYQVKCPNPSCGRALDFVKGTLDPRQVHHNPDHDPNAASATRFAACVDLGRVLPWTVASEATLERLNGGQPVGVPRGNPHDTTEQLLRIVRAIAAQDEARWEPLREAERVLRRAHDRMCNVVHRRYLSELSAYVWQVVKTTAPANLGTAAAHLGSTLVGKLYLTLVQRQVYFATLEGFQGRMWGLAARHPALLSLVQKAMDGFPPAEQVAGLDAADMDAAMQALAAQLPSLMQDAVDTYNSAAAELGMVDPNVTKLENLWRPAIGVGARWLPTPPKAPQASVAPPVDLLDHFLRAAILL